MSCFIFRGLEANSKISFLSHFGARLVFIPRLYRLMTMTAIITDTEVIVMTRHRYIPAIIKETEVNLKITKKTFQIHLFPNFPDMFVFRITKYSMRQLFRMINSKMYNAFDIFFYYLIGGSCLSMLGITSARNLTF